MDVDGNSRIESRIEKAEGPATTRHGKPFSLCSKGRHGQVQIWAAFSLLFENFIYIV